MQSEELVLAQKHQRIAWVDISKAILILLMVLGHAGFPSIVYAYLFHMPAFFFLSGFTFSESNKPISYLVKTVKTILIPAFAINVFFMVCYWLIAKLGLYNLFFEPVEVFSLKALLIDLFKHLNTVEWGGATWFLFALFFTGNFFAVLKALFGKIAGGRFQLDIIASAALAFFGLYLSRQGVFVYNIDLALYALLYYSCGVLCKRLNLFEKFDDKYMVPICVAATVFFGSFYFRGRLAMNWPTRDFDNVFINFCAFFCAFYLCRKLAILLVDSGVGKALEYIGKRTYSILVLHFFAFKIIYLFQVLLFNYPKEHLLNFVPPVSSTPMWLVYASLSVLICLLISFAAQRFAVLNYLFNAKITKKEKSCEKEE